MPASPVAACAARLHASVLTVAGVVTVAAGLPAAAAAAPTLQADRPCFTPRERVQLTGGGYTPGGQIAFVYTLTSASGTRQVEVPARATTDAAGALNVTLRAPDFAFRTDERERVTVTARDQARVAAQPPPLPADQAGVTGFWLSRFELEVDAWSAGRADPRRQARLRAIGWEPYRVLWAHYFRGRDRVRTVRIGRLSGACGHLTRRIRQFPFRPVPAGRWTIYFSPSRTFDPDGLWIPRRVVVPQDRAVP